MQNSKKSFGGPAAHVTKVEDKETKEFADDIMNKRKNLIAG
jgi:hypothetical protein